MKVCIAEKPSVARDIASILKANSRKDGFFEGNGFQVTWVYGHLCELKDPEDYSNDWKFWNFRYLPMIPNQFSIRIKKDEGVQKQFNIIANLIKNAEEVINCGDAGQEGELIQRWVMQKANCKCPVKRLWISSLTEESIREGFANLKDQSEFDKLYQAGLARAIGDWLLGMNATRAFSLKYNSPGQKTPLSIGRVQTPTLALIVNRQLEIQNFIPTPYWELKTTYRDTIFSVTSGKFDKKEEGLALLEQVKNAPFSIKDVSKKEGTEAPPRLFDLTSLQVECNKKFAFSADDTLKIIQSLYEKKITTYPRVDTTYLSDDIYPKIPGILANLKEYNAFTAPILKNKIPKSKKVFDNSKVTDHHAIIPTGVVPQNITDVERKVYDLLCRRFIANFYPNCKFSTTTALGEAAKIEFKVTGKQILEPGWRVLFEKTNIQENENNNDEEKTLPDFIVGESGPHTPELAEKQTTPPKPYTEATLLRAMETAGKLVDNEELRDALKENGIGRPSTRAAIIETLFKRHYIEKQRKNLIATSTGIDLIRLIKDDILKSAELTGQWEKKLREIERGEYPITDFINELKKMTIDVVNTVRQDNTGKRVSPQSSIVSELKEKKKNVPKKDNVKLPIEGQACPKCGQGLIIKGRTAWGCSRYKEGCDWRFYFEKKE